MRRIIATIAMTASILGVSLPGVATAQPGYGHGNQGRPVYFEGSDRPPPRGDDRGARRGDDRGGPRGDDRGYRGGDDRGGPRGDDRGDPSRRDGYGRDGYGRDGYRGRDGYAYDDRGGRRFQDNRCRRNDGSTGTILGAIAGGLIGNGVAGRHDRTLGTVLGAGGGAVVGNSIDRTRC